MGWLGAVRDGIRAVFGERRSAGGMVATKLRDLGVLATLGVGIALSAVLTSAVGVAAGWMADQLGMPGQEWIVRIAGLAVGVLADTGLMLVLLRVVSGALVGGVGLNLLKISATALLPRLTDNPFFASFAIVVGLLIWLNLISRLTLIAAAWAANDVEGYRGAELQPQVQGPSGVSSGATAVRGDLPTFGAPAQDRAAVASGFVLGLAATAALRVLARGLRSLTRLGRD